MPELAKAALPMPELAKAAQPGSELARAGQPGSELSVALGWLEARTAGLPELCAGDLTRPTTLPGWTRAHLLSHLARNADALGNLVTWARTGVPTPMYADADGRVADIESGARRPDPVIVEDVLSSAARLSAGLTALDAPQWTAVVRTVRGNEIPAMRIPWLRVRELAVHAVDLGARFDDLPDDLVHALLADAVTVYAGREGCPSVRLVPVRASAPATGRPGPAGGSGLAAGGSESDRGGSESDGGAGLPEPTPGPAPGPMWTIGQPDGATPTVRGTAPQLLGWITGRTAGTGLVSSAGDLPTLPPWL